MPGSQVRLDLYDATTYSCGRGIFIQALWFFVGLPLLRAAWNPSSAFRRALLRAFGARIGRGVVLKPGVRVKYPWLLEVGDHAWIGEDAWIDNLALVRIGDHCCVSQGVYFCTGNHDWSDPRFALRTGGITMEAGSWAGARSVLGPGVTLSSHAVLTAGSVATGPVPAWEIHGGHPATFLRHRPLRAVHN